MRVLVLPMKANVLILVALGTTKTANKREYCCKHVGDSEMQLCIKCYVNHRNSDLGRGSR